MNIVVRLDISRNLGTGHWRRMCNLMDAMPEARVTFVVGTDDPQNPLFSDRCVRFLSDDRDLAELDRICHHVQADLIILDLLRYPPDFLQRVKHVSGRKVVTFHEYTDWSGAADLAVNYNTFNGFEQVSSSRVLAGPAYCVLNTRCLQISRAAQTSGVLVTFGGSDPSRFGDTFLEKVISALPQIPFVMHEGPFAANAARGDRWVGRSNVRFTGPNDSFFDLMASCRMAVTAGGNSMYELMFLGYLPLVVAHNAHQAEFAGNAARLGAAHFFGVNPSVDWTGLTAEIAARYHHPPKPVRSLIDGQGARRIIDRLRLLRP
jgi:spore coat polysaccharide biosynthesis predicted glycosyltransferase SpsG